jgi:hypothetical protein
MIDLVPVLAWAGQLGSEEGSGVSFRPLYLVPIVVAALAAFNAGFAFLVQAKSWKSRLSFERYGRILFLMLFSIQLVLALAPIALVVRAVDRGLELTAENYGMPALGLALVVLCLYQQIRIIQAYHRNHVG